MHIINHVSISFRQAKKSTEPLALEKAIGVGTPIRTFGDNFAHARVKGHDCENGEYLNSK